MNLASALQLSVYLSDCVFEEGVQNELWIRTMFSIIQFGIGTDLIRLQLGQWLRVMIDLEGPVS
jgi:hypothetical protein